MKPRLLEYLACPACGAAFALEAERVDGQEVIDGALRCQGCARRYAILRGIPRLLPGTLSTDERRTAAAFGWQWQHFVEMHPQYEAQFLDWIRPIDPAFFQGKVVLDAGCGIGRHAFFAARYGAQDVLAIDLSGAVETAYQTLGHLPNAHVIQADLFHPPFAHRAQGGPFDFIYSIGVLHHLPDPEGGFRALSACLRPGGTLFGWVYGYENTGLLRLVVDPIRRRFTSRLPPPLLRVIAWPLALVLFAAVQVIYRPLRRTGAGRRLPAHAYLLSLAPFSFRQHYNIVFDHLVAPTAFYLKREEFEAWFHRAGLEAVELSWRNRNSWRGRGRMPRFESPSPLRGGLGRGSGA